METKKMEELYSEIGNLLVTMIPEDWIKVYTYAELREGYQKVFFYYVSADKDVPVYSLDITDLFEVDEELFEEMEDRLYDCFTELREEFLAQEQEPWTHLTFILDHEGQLKINYGYEDLSQLSPVDKREKWEREYLGQNY